MERFVIRQLLEWKRSRRRKPLIVEGARQVGKTWAVRTFGQRYYKHLAYINFEEAKHLRDLFRQDYDTTRVLRAIRTQCNVPCIAGETLIFLDEIQEAEGGLTMLKYFQEHCPEQHIIVAGSLLGIAIHRGISFPVGKVNFLKVYPMNFREFLMAIGERALCAAVSHNDWNTLALFHDKLNEHLKNYYYVGGMPEVVQAFVDDAEWSEVRTIQQEILRGYENDFSKHTDGVLTERIRQVWRSVPNQLSKENRKFVFGLVRDGARAREYENALQWLVDAGVLYQVNGLSAPRVPLESYRESKHFKVFVNDIGLLSAMSGLSVETLLHDTAIFTEFKGALTEQYVFQQLNEVVQLFYWSKDKSHQEVDFVVQRANEVIPIECKSEENLKAKSLTSFIGEHKTTRAIKVTMKPHKASGDVVENVPLYGIQTAFV